MPSFTAGLTQPAADPAKKAPPPSRNVGFTMNSMKSLESSKTVKLSTFAQAVKEPEIIPIKQQAQVEQLKEEVKAIDIA